MTNKCVLSLLQNVFLSPAATLEKQKKSKKTKSDHKI
jgi:hypothetical protein